jgi:hypothetical protein
MLSKAEPSVERERAITRILKSQSNAPAALTQSLGVTNDSIVSRNSAKSPYFTQDRRKKK